MGLHLKFFEYSDLVDKRFKAHTVVNNVTNLLHTA